MSMTWTQIKALGRKFASDTDTTNPFWTDTEVTLLCENFQSDLASYLRWPRATGSVVTQVVGQDDYDLPTDWIATISVRTYDSSGYETYLTYKNEEEIEKFDPNWRNNTDYADPRYWFIANDVTVGTSLSRKLFVYPPPKTARSMQQTYVKVPTAIAADSNIPIFPGTMHILAAYYLGWQMNIPLNAPQAETYKALYEKERRRLLGEGLKDNERSNVIQMR